MKDLKLKHIMLAKDDLIILQRGLALKKKKKVKITGKEASDNQGAADKFPDTTKKIIQEKGYLPEQVFNTNGSVLFWWGGWEKETPKDSIS